VLILSLRAIARRILGRRGTFLLRNMVSEIAFRIGYYEDPRSRPQGISAMVITYNEEDWIEPSILSIKDLVDEYIVMDSSTDKTPEIVERVKNEHGLNIKLRRIPPGNIVATRNEALKNSSYRWILVWDGDFVLYDDKAKIVRNLIQNLDPRKHYLVYWPMIQLCGDLHHLCGNYIHIEHWLYTWSSRTRYAYIGARDSLIAPLRLYKPIIITEPLGLHIQARKPKRTAIKHLWYKHREYFEKNREDPEKIAREIALNTFGTEDLNEIGKRLIKDIVVNLQEYKGPYPGVLLRYLKTNSYGE
jgi:glycosyltransferase involved in cell wall biosynthesis